MRQKPKEIQRSKELTKYIEKFGKEPNIIGMYWQDPEQLKENLLKAIKKDEPYDEYELLSKDEQRDYDAGNLLF